MKLDIIGKRKYTYVFSGALVVASIATFSVFGLRLGIDFTGGTEIRVGFENGRPEKPALENDLRELGLASLSVVETEENDFILRYRESDEETNQRVMERIREKNPEAEEKSVDFVGASISRQLKSNALKAFIFAILGIAGYIAWAFRKVSRPVASWKYGIGAVAALFHDIIITVGVFSLLGRLYGIEVGVPFVAAILTILGYSVNDTIVVYDRTRENLIKSGNKEDFETVVNRSLNETLARSINTSLTVMIVLVGIILWGGEAVRSFSLALLVGVAFGTYSSIYVASAFLVSIFQFQKKAR